MPWAYPDVEPTAPHAGPRPSPYEAADREIAAFSLALRQVQQQLEIELRAVRPVHPRTEGHSPPVITVEEMARAAKERIGALEEDHARAVERIRREVAARSPLPLDALTPEGGAP